jgi:ABC-type branched-subunit amino acid transport system permease subunit
VLTFLSEGLRYLEDLFKMEIRLVFYGLLLVLTILFMRGGLVGLFRSIQGWLSDYRSSGQGGAEE